MPPLNTCSHISLSSLEQGRELSSEYLTTERDLLSTPLFLYL